MIAKEKVIKRIQAQIELCKEIDSDWISLTVGTGKRILELLDGPEVVRCKDCKHRPKEIPFVTSYGEHDTYLDFPNGSKCPCQNTSDQYYSWNPEDDWFCADGERK